MSSAMWITLWNESAAQWSTAMGRACWQGGVFVLIVWGVCQRWRRIPPALRYGLWWLVCLKLLLGLCPAFFALPLLPPVAETLPAVVSPQSPTSPQMTVLPLTRLPAELLSSAPVTDAGGTPPRLSGKGWLLGVWLAVTAILIGFSALSLHRLRLLLREAEPLTDPTLLSMANEAAAAIGLRTLPRLLITRHDVGALTLGVWRPAVLLSQRAVACCSPSELRLVFAHEFAHLRRGDAWLGLLPHLTQILFCFHPLVWLACRELVLAREAACDEQTLCSLHARSDLYGRLLLKLGVRQTAWFALCTPGVSSHFRILHRRISMLAQISEGSPRRKQGSVALFVCLIGAALTAPWNIVHAQNPSRKPSGTIVSREEKAAIRREAAGNKAQDDVHATSKNQRPLTLALNPAKNPPVLAQRKPTASGKGKPITVASKKGSPAPLTSMPTEAQSRVLETRVFKLQYADAETVARTLTLLFEDKRVKIVSDVRTNTILVRANAEQTREILDLMQELDAENSAKQQEPGSDVRIIPLKYIQAVEMASTLTTLFGERGAKTVRITADSRTNTLLIQASNEEIKKILALTERLDIDPK